MSFADKTVDIVERLREYADLDAAEGGEPGAVAMTREAANEIERLRETLSGIANADWRNWQELARPEEFVRWAKSRAQHALTHNDLLRGKPAKENYEQRTN